MGYPGRLERTFPVQLNHRESPRPAKVRVPRRNVDEIARRVGANRVPVGGVPHAEHECPRQHRQMLAARVPVNGKFVSIGELQAESVIALRAGIAVQHRDLRPGIEAGAEKSVQASRSHRADEG